MAALKFGMTLPYGDARVAADLARLAEENGWDGVFVGDAIWCIDPLIQLTAAAMTTSRIRLGTMVLAMPLRRPNHLASESLAIDRLSQGRLMLGLGTGATWMGWHGFPDEVTDTRARAEMLDEAIDIITRMHQTEQFDYDGKHYHIKLTRLDTIHYPPKTIQQPRVPIWIPGVWPRMKSMRRVLKCDGLLPFKMNAEGKFEDVTPADLCEMKAFVDTNRTLTTPFDYVVEGQTHALDRAQTRDRIMPWVEAGITWWIEGMWNVPLEEFGERIRQGPPQLN
jgi:hypothetical protein